MLDKVKFRLYSLSKIKKLLVVVITIFLIYLLMKVVVYYKIPLCIHKIITGKDCFGCGMTRAFNAVFNLQFKEAYAYNKRVIIVFPLMSLLVLNMIIKFIFNVEGKELWKIITIKLTTIINKTIIHQK